MAPAISTRLSGSVRDVLRMSLPLVMAASGHAIRLFCDRVMLSRYSRSAISGSMTAGMTCFALMAFFLGTSRYAGTFVAQYTGAGKRDRAGSAVWQGIWVALVGGLVLSLIGMNADFIFDLVGHSPEIRAQEVIYFSVLCQFTTAPLILTAIEALWSGQGRTRIVMVIELVAATVNVLLNWIFIFGWGPIPEMGIFGAGLATGLSSIVALVLAVTLFLHRSNRLELGTWPRRTFNPALMLRLLKFGVSDGLQFMLDMMAFSFFVIFMGRVGNVELEAATISFSINGTVFIPMLGIGATASIMVGQGIGGRNIPMARRAVRSALFLALGYMLCVSMLFVFFPDVVLSLFRRPGDTTQPEVLALARNCLRFIAVYLLFDAVAIVYHNAIRGAGDTRFAMLASILLAWGTLVLPCAFLLWTGASVWWFWSIFVMHVILFGTVVFMRYQHGAWQRMRVIE